MKLTSIALRHFRSSINLNLPTNAARVLIAGVNGSGKTSIREAVAWVLQGRCSATDARGQGWEKLVPEGTTTVAAGLCVEGLGAVEREYKNGSRNFSVESFTGEPTVQQQALYAKLATSPAFLDAVLDTSVFLSLQHAPAKALVLDLLQARIPIGEESLTLDQLDERYRQAFEGRKAAKIKAKAHALPQKPEAEPMPPVAVVESKLAEVRAELQTLATGAGANAGKREILQQKLQAAEQLEIEGDPVDPAYLADLEERLAIMEADHVEPLSLHGLPDWEDNLHTVPYMGIPRDLMDIPVADENSPAGLTHRIARLAEHKPKQGCVLDLEVRCDTAKLVFTNRAKVLKEQLAATPPTAPLPAAQKPLPAGPTPLQTTRTVLAEAKAHSATFEAVAARNASKRAEAEALRAQLSSLKDDSQALAEIDTLKARIGKGELLLARARSHWQIDSAYKLAVAKKAEFDGEVERLEALCDLLGPNGARVKALADAVGVFEAKVNAFTSAFNWTIAFQIDPWQVTANGRAVETYSESEQFSIGIALQLAIAELSGLSFAIVDRLDMLTMQNRKHVTAMLMNSTVGQIFILASREPEQELPHNMAGVLAYRLGKENGRTQILEGAS